jgi:hypothetical protein
VSEVGDKSVLDVIDLSHRNPTVPLPASASLLEAIDAFVRHSPRPRQLVITTTANAEVSEYRRPPSMIARLTDGGAEVGHTFYHSMQENGDGGLIGCMGFDPFLFHRVLERSRSILAT